MRRTWKLLLCPFKYPNLVVLLWVLVKSMSSILCSLYLVLNGLLIITFRIQLNYKIPFLFKYVLVLCRFLDSSPQLSSGSNNYQSRDTWVEPPLPSFKSFLNYCFIEASGSSCSSAVRDACTTLCVYGSWLVALWKLPPITPSFTYQSYGALPSFILTFIYALSHLHVFVDTCYTSIKDTYRHQAVS